LAAPKALRLLVVEDDVVDKTMLTRLLARSSLAISEVQCVDRVAEALDRVSRFSFDIILLDLGLPDSEGMDSVTQLQAEAPHIPIIVLTGLDDEDAATQAVHKGVQDYLVKGQVDGHLLVRSIRYALERKKAERELQVAEERYRTIFENSAVAIMMVNREERLVSWNQYTERLLGMTPSDLLGRDLASLYPPLVWERIREKSVHESGMEHHLETKMVHKDGRVIDVDISLSMLHDSDGDVTGAICVVQDVTERKHMEEALRRSEKRFRQVAANAKEWIWEVDAEGYYTYTSPVVEQVLGYTPEEILGGKHFHDFFHPDEAERMQAQSTRIFRCKDVFRDIQARAVHKNGTVVWLQRSGVPILGENQELLGYRGADVDITARVGAQQALRCHVREIERFNHLATARELRVIELKRRVNELARASGQTPPYESLAEGACMEEAETEGSARQVQAQPQPAREGTEYCLEDLLDRDQIQRLLESCCDGFGISAAVINARGELFVSTRWQRICADFHRVNEHTCRRCIESDTVLANRLEEGASFSLYQCGNGLTDAASPILIEGRHLGNVFVGQFLVEPPDEDFFRSQAAQFGFDEVAYLEALSRVPVVPKEKLPVILGYLTTCAALVAEMGLERIRSKTYEGDLIRRAEALDRVNRELRGQRAAALSLAEDANEARTAAERARRSLQDSEERLRSMTAAAHDAIIMMDERGAISFWNHAAQIMFGYSKDEARTRNLRDLLASAGYEDACREGVVYSAESEEGFVLGKTLELTALRRSGEEFPIELSVAPVRLHGRYQTVGIIRDISERKRIHEILDRKQKNLEAIFDAAPFGMLLVNEDHAVARANDAVRHMSGQEYKEILGRDVCRALACARRASAPDDRESSCQECSLGRFIRATLESGTPVHGVEARPVLNDSGQQVRPWLSVSVVPVDIDGGKHVVVALNDITDRKRAEAELRETMDLKSQFISTVSHELRTPLTAIREGVIIVSDEVAGKLKKDQKHFLGIARRNIDRLARLIDDVLDFQKLTAGKMDFLRQPHSVAQTVEEIYATMSPHARKKNVHLATEVEAGLPPAVYDSDRIVQVLTNLVSNAIKFTPEGGTVSISARHSDENLLLQVSDTGMGIPKEALSKIFNRFYRVHRPGREIKGTGLGLAIVHKIVTAHGGRIDVESEMDQGTTFTVTLPLTARQPAGGPHEGADGQLETMLAETSEG